MRPWWPLLAGLALLAPPEVQSEDAPSGGHPALGGFASMDPAAQREWVQQMLTRLDRANRLVLDPNEVVRKRTQYVLLLRRMAQGKTLSQQEVLRLLREIDEREKAAIERLARQFRLQVYRTFRQSRGVFTRRRAAWNRVLAGWEAAGGRFDGQDRLIDWLELAIRSSTPGTVGPLPAEPKFETALDLPSALVLRPPTERIDQSSAIPPPEPAASVPRRDRRVAELKKPLQPSIEATDLPRPVVLPSASVASRKTAAPEPVFGQAIVGRPSPTATRLPAGFPPIAEQPTPAIIPPPRSMLAEAGVPAAVLRPRRAAETLLRVPRQPATAGQPSDRPGPLVFPAAVPLQWPANPEPIAARYETKRPPPRTTGELVAVWARLESVAPASPQVADPPPTETPQARRVRVNLDELTAHIAGANLALRALEAELDQKRQWNARQLGPLVDQLGILAARRGDLELVRELISQREQALVGRLESPQAVITQLAARIFQARTRMGASQFPGSEAQRQAELQHLEELSRQLAKLASEK